MRITSDLLVASPPAVRQRSHDLQRVAAGRGLIVLAYAAGNLPGFLQVPAASGSRKRADFAWLRVPAAPWLRSTASPWDTKLLQREHRNNACSEHSGSSSKTCCPGKLN